MSVLKIPRETFQEHCMLFKDGGPGSVSGAAPGTPVCPVHPALMKFHWADALSGEDCFAAGLKAQHREQNICIRSTGRATFPLSLTSRRSLAIVEEACPDPYAVHSCTTVSVAHTSVLGHVHSVMEMRLQLSTLSCRGGSRSQLVTSLHSYGEGV